MMLPPMSIRCVLQMNHFATQNNVQKSTAQLDLEWAHQQQTASEQRTKLFLSIVTVTYAAVQKTT